MSRIGKFTETESRLVVARHIGMSTMEITSNEYEISFG